MIYLANNKPETISRIVITALPKITNIGLKELISKNNENLMHLTLSILPQKNLDGNLFMEIIHKCKKLNYLDISGITNTNIINLDSIFTAQYEYLKYINVSGINTVTDSHIQGCLMNCKSLEVLRTSNCGMLSNSILDSIISNGNELKLKVLEINRTPFITDGKIEEAMIILSPNLKIYRATNHVWNIKNNGYKVPLIAKGFVRKDPKAKKAPAKNKNDDKNPVNQLKKLLEEAKPKMILDLFAAKKGKKGKKTGKKK